MGLWERKAAPFDGLSVIGASKTTRLDIAVRTATLPAQGIEQFLAQPFGILSQQGSDLPGATCRSTGGPSVAVMPEATAWDLSMPQAIGAAEAAIGLTTRASAARMASRKCAMV